MNPINQNRKTRVSTIFLLCALTLVLTLISPVQAGKGGGAPAPGSLDTTFGTGGLATGGGGAAFDIAIQADAKIVVVSPNCAFVVERYNINGTLDTDFGTNGRVTTDINPTLCGDVYNDVGSVAVTIQTDGKIVVAGTTNNPDYRYNFVVARYNTDGSLDSTFGPGGLVRTDFGSSSTAQAIVIQTNGKIVVGGTVTTGGSNKDFALARYNANGSLDSTFGVGGKVVTDFGSFEDIYSLAIQGDDKIVAGGQSGLDFALARYNADGSPDAAFGIGGRVKTRITGYDFARGMALQSDGKIVVAGENAVARFNSDGGLDTSFGVNGGVIIDFGANYRNQGLDMVLQADGKIVVVGLAWISVVKTRPYHEPKVTDELGFGLARYNANGSFDTAFDKDGKVITNFVSSRSEANAVAIQDDGKIVAAGQSAGYIALARYLP